MWENGNMYTDKQSKNKKKNKTKKMRISEDTLMYILVFGKRKMVLCFKH